VVKFVEAKERFSKQRLKSKELLAACTHLPQIYEDVPTAEESLISAVDYRA